MTDQELDSLLYQWKKWCFWHDQAIGPEHVECGSMEKNWRSPQCWDAPEPRQDEPRDWIGVKVERAVQRLPERNRAVLRMEFLGVAVINGRKKIARRGLGQSSDQLADRKRRCLMMAQRDYDEALYDARIMLRNILRTI